MASNTKSNYTTWKLARMNLAIRGIDANLGPRNADISGLNSTEVRELAVLIPLSEVLRVHVGDKPVEACA